MTYPLSAVRAHNVIPAYREWLKIIGGAALLLLGLILLLGFSTCTTIAGVAALLIGGFILYAELSDRVHFITIFIEDGPFIVTAPGSLKNVTSKWVSLNIAVEDARRMKLYQNR